MFERLIILTVVALVGVAAYQLWQRQQRRAIAQQADDPIRHQLDGLRPAIVYFTTPQCVPCRMQQQPALAQLLAQLGDEAVQIVRIDATQQPDLAAQWRVMSVPTTIILDRAGPAPQRQPRPDDSRCAATTVARCRMTGLVAPVAPVAARRSRRR